MMGVILLRYRIFILSSALFIWTACLSIAQANNDKVLGFSVTSGAAAGYIEDVACKQCHPVHWDGYQEVGMSHSFSAVKPERLIENFDLPPYFHEPSQRYYHVTKNGDNLTFKRYQLDDKGQPINVFERHIDWIVGSGNKTRSYLYQTELGEIFQLPLGWYTQTQQWLMGPGFEMSHHFGVERSIRRECLFCHNAFPNVPTGSDQRTKLHLFPDTLPEGTGCQRCHGPGAEHVKTVLSGAPVDHIRSKIVNPAKLPPKQRDSVCFQCHLLPAVSMIGVRKFGRNDYSFRPGESIGDYMVHVDIDSENKPQSERFEINHHAYRLRQSECFTKSNNQLTCISCHNPHKKVPEQQRIEHYGAVCLSCHEKQHPILAGGPQVDTSSDCMSCHMPQRRTQDVIHVTMTDHKIQRHAASQAERLAPLTRTEGTIDKVELLMPDASVAGAVGEVYRAIAILRGVISQAAIEYLEGLLTNIKNLPPMVPLELAAFQVKKGRYQQAQKSLDVVLKDLPDNAHALKLQGVVFQSQKKYAKSLEMYRKALLISPNDPDVHFNLGVNHYTQNHYDLAAESFNKAVSLRPNMKIGWFYLAETAMLKQQLTQAVDYYKKALSIDPSFDRAYVKLAEVMVQNNQKSEALRYLRHGAKVARDNNAINLALEKIHQSQ